jgi:hypothetical protein
MDDTRRFIIFLWAALHSPSSTLLPEKLTADAATAFRANLKLSILRLTGNNFTCKGRGPSPRGLGLEFFFPCHFKSSPLAPLGVIPLPPSQMPKSNQSSSPPSHSHARTGSDDTSPRMSDVALRKKKNADAQAAFRQRRANYIATLEETGSIVRLCKDPL